MRPMFLLILMMFFCPIILAVEYEKGNQYHNIVEETIVSTGFNGTVLISKDGRVVFHENIGFSDDDRENRISDKHLFCPGSVGKEFTTVSIMQLVEQGKLSYKDSIAEYISGFPSWAKKYNCGAYSYSHFRFTKGQMEKIY